MLNGRGGFGVECLLHKRRDSAAAVQIPREASCMEEFIWRNLSGGIYQAINIITLSYPTHIHYSTYSTNKDSFSTNEYAKVSYPGFLAKVNGGV